MTAINWSDLRAAGFPVAALLTTGCIIQRAAVTRVNGCILVTVSFIGHAPARNMRPGWKFDRWEKAHGAVSVTWKKTGG
jgi:hypothetical protein